MMLFFTLIGIILFFIIFVIPNMKYQIDFPVGLVKKYQKSYKEIEKRFPEFTLNNYNNPGYCADCGKKRIWVIWKTGYDEQTGYENLELKLTCVDNTTPNIRCYNTSRY